MPVMEEAIFELDSGRAELGSALVLDDIDFKLSPGEFLALLGSNGAGKTTLVRALLGLVPLSAGDLRLFARPVGEFRDWFRIGYVPQRLSAPSGAPASVMEVVLSGRVGRARRLKPYGRGDRNAALGALEAVGLADLADVPFARLSAGQQQRVLIARALAAGPDVLVLDEPVSGVDLEHQHSFAGVLKAFIGAGGSVLLVAHSLASIEGLVSREVVMHAGKITYEGPHLPHHVHAEHVHHPERPIEPSPLDRAAGGH